MSNNTKDNRSLFSKLLNHSITLEVSFHWFTFVISCICWFILSRMTLLFFLHLILKGSLNGVKSYLESPLCVPLLLYMLLFLAVFLSCLTCVVSLLSFCYPFLLSCYISSHNKILLRPRNTEYGCNCRT